MNFTNQPTATALRDWTFGSTEAERLCASLLYVEGAKAVDPQSPFGGPDGVKDLVCELNGWKYIVAAYFPSKEKSLKDIKAKFSDDLVGVSKNSAQGIAFFTNQHLTPGERGELESLAHAKKAESIIYHRERIKAILDAPRGYGVRLQYLKIPMSPEYQSSFFAQFGVDLMKAFEIQVSSLNMLSKQVSALHEHFLGGGELPGLDFHRLVVAATQATIAKVGCEPLPHSSKHALRLPPLAFLTKGLDIPLLCSLHRALLFQSETQATSGVFRAARVWIGIAGSSPKNARFVAPEPNKVPELIDALLKSWRECYDKLLESSKTEIISSIVRFHHEFLRIHPFLDGNGRLARLLLEQQGHELLSLQNPVVLDDSPAYFDALDAAHKGDLHPLTNVITQSMFGSESI